MEYLNISYDTLFQDVMMLSVTVVAIASAFNALSKNNLLSGDYESVFVSLIEIVGAIVLYILVAVQVYLAITYEPNLLKTILMVLGGIYVVVLPLAILIKLFFYIKSLVLQNNK